MTTMQDRWRKYLGEIERFWTTCLKVARSKLDWYAEAVGAVPAPVIPENDTRMAGILDKDGWACSGCGHFNEYWYSNICDQCGKGYSDEPHMWKCSECGTANRLTNYYCDNCHHRHKMISAF